MNLDTVTIVCIALMGILLFVLGANVSRNRALRGAGNQLPSDPSDKLLIAIRAHGNAAEYIPTMIVLLLVCSVLSDSWAVDVLAIAAVFVRYVHAFGMLASRSLATHGPLRDVGAMGTYLVGIALGVTALVTI
ncbi:MAPEG family protein [Kribbella sp. CA-245084]|uniref:MAPEG family protein n=1 Tax=Kribbella sp. CA-245084 TaxID=3239940 RepID=UPI003D8FDB23